MKKPTILYKQIAISALFCVVLFSTSACVKTVRQVGYNFENAKTDSFKVGKTRKALVKRELGSPSIISTYGDDTWYYIATEYESVAFFKPKIKQQRVLQVKFNKDQTIKSIKEFDELDARDVSFSAEKTKTEGHDIGILGQLLGNVGRFNSSGKDAAKPTTSRP